MPPRSFDDASSIVREKLFLFVNPLDFTIPFLGPTISAVPTLASVCFVGIASLWNRARWAFAMLALPYVLVMLAACVRLYPFHGRLVLFLAPLLLFIAEGAGGRERARDARRGPS